MRVAIRIQPLTGGEPDGAPLTVIGVLTDGTFTAAAETAPGQEAEVFAVELDEAGEEDAVLSLGLELGLGTRGVPEAAEERPAPVLSLAADAAEGRTGGTGSVSTDVAGGTLFWVVTRTATPPSAPQVRAGEDHAGAMAAASGSQAVVSTGPQNIAASGLLAATRYWTHFVQEDLAGTMSAVASADGFTTEAAVTLASPFANGEQGAWLLPGTEHGTMHQEIAEPFETPVAHGDPVGSYLCHVTGIRFVAETLERRMTYNSAGYLEWTGEYLPGNSPGLEAIGIGITHKPGWRIAGAVRLSDAGSSTGSRAFGSVGETFNSRFEVMYRPASADVRILTRGTNHTGGTSTLKSVSAGSGSFAPDTDYVFVAGLDAGRTSLELNGQTVIDAANDWTAGMFSQEGHAGLSTIGTNSGSYLRDYGHLWIDRALTPEEEAFVRDLFAARSGVTL